MAQIFMKNIRFRAEFLTKWVPKKLRTTENFEGQAVEKFTRRNYPRNRFDPKSSFRVQIVGENIHFWNSLMKSCFPHQFFYVFKISFRQEFLSVRPTFLKESSPKLLFFFRIVNLVNLLLHFIFSRHFAYCLSSFNILLIIL